MTALECEGVNDIGLDDDRSNPGRAQGQGFRPFSPHWICQGEQTRLISSNSHSWPMPRSSGAPVQPLSYSSAVVRMLGPRGSAP